MIKLENTFLESDVLRSIKNKDLTKIMCKYLHGKFDSECIMGQLLEYGYFLKLSENSRHTVFLKVHFIII